MAVLISVLSDILKVVIDEEGHNVEELAKKVKLPVEAARKTVEFLAKYGFIEFNVKSKKIRSKV